MDNKNAIIAASCVSTIVLAWKYRKMKKDCQKVLVIAKRLHAMSDELVQRAVDVQFDEIVENYDY